MADKPNGLALLLMGKKHPDMKPKMDEPDMDDSDTVPEEVPPTMEELACARDVMDAVKLDNPDKLVMALKDIFKEFDKEPNEEADHSEDEPEEDSEPEESPDMDE